MKVAILADPDRPKVGLHNIARVVEEAGLEVGERGGEIGVVVGGDGVFSYYGRIKSIPLLFVGVRSKVATGSKAYLAELYLDGLRRALRKISRRKYIIVEHGRLEVLMDGSRLGEVFTDVFLERGADSNCLRYKLMTRGADFGFTDFAIANGVIVSTSAGSAGYFSYLDKLRGGEGFESKRSSKIAEDQIGIAHIVPTYTLREGAPRKHPLRYTVPWQSEVRIQLTRDADARLHGLTRSRKGIKVTTEDIVRIRPSGNVTRVIKVL